VRGDVHEVAERAHDLEDLLRKLAGRSEDQSLALAEVGIKALQDADGERGGLAGSCSDAANSTVTVSIQAQTHFDTCRD
jgi:hypothetical protein